MPPVGIKQAILSWAGIRDSPARYVFLHISDITPSAIYWDDSMYRTEQ